MDPSEARSDLFLRQRNALNLQVLQTYNPKIHSIIDSSSYVVLYEFDAAKGEWAKMGYEGTLFLYLEADGTTKYLVLNRLSLSSPVFTVKPNASDEDPDIMKMNEYVIHRGAKGKMAGLWIFEGEDRERIYQRLVNMQRSAAFLRLEKGLVPRAGDARPAPPPPMPPAPPTPATADATAIPTSRRISLSDLFARK